MPKQSRGFWVCDFCGLTFDGHDEARYHELEECQHRSRQAAHLDSNREQAYAPPMMPPLGLPEKPPATYDYELSVQQPRRIPLMGLHETGHLTEADTALCQNVELFEASDLVSDQQGTAMSRGQVGLRCLHCIGSQTAGSVVFPRSLAVVGDSVRILADRHMCRCAALPVALAHELEQAANKRQQAKDEGGPSWHEEESNRRDLVDFCAHRCQEIGITEKYPVDSGLLFRDSEMRQGMKGPVPVPTRRYPPGGGVFPTRYAMGPGGNEPMPPASLPRRLSPVPPTTQDSELSGMKVQQLPTYDMPANFPFFQDPGGDWICKFCSHLHPQYRDPQYIWSAPGRVPPPGQFIEHHLGMCRAYHQNMNQQQQQQQHQMPSRSEYQESTPQYGYPQQPIAYGSPQPNWETQSEPRGPSMVSPRKMHHSSNFASASGEHQPSSFEEFAPQPRRGPPHSFREPTYQHMPPQKSIVPPRSEGKTDHAVDFLAVNDKSLYKLDGSPISAASILVVEEDKLLLTDYFYWLMKQLRMVHFSEADRKTRGGKREKIKVGYGGLQCVHCADLPNSRKFFWSNVDRLANSFAEIPAHVLKCRRCPQPTKDAIHQLKEKHPEQMARLPRGSQKVFFRRMWRRVHPVQKPGDLSAANNENPSSISMLGEAGQPALEVKPTAQDSPGTIGSEESVLLLERPTKEAAKALADASMQDGPPSPSSRILLAIPEDKEWLSDTDVFVRRQLEVFCATMDDVETARSDRKYPVYEGQVGIRCVHCALSKGAKGSGVAYPFSISAIYESVREFQRLHLEGCANLAPSVKSRLTDLKGASSLSSVLRKYYVLAARALGLKDTRDGIRPGGESIPLGSQVAFAFSDTSSKVSEEIGRTKTADGGSDSSSHQTPMHHRKRRPDAEASRSSNSKKSSKTYPDVENQGG